MAEAIYLSNVRLSFPKLIEAVAPQGSPGAVKKFGCDLILPQTHPDFARFMGEVGKVATEKWKDNAGLILKLIQPDRRLRCWGQGDEKVDKKTLQPYLGYAGMAYISASSNEEHPPQIVRENGQIVDNPMERATLARKLYGGCYVNAAVRPWPQDNQYGRGVRCELIAVQFAKDGEAFGEISPDVSGMFGAVQGAPAPATPSFLGGDTPPWL